LTGAAPERNVFEMRVRQLVMAVLVLDAVAIRPAPASACDSTGCLLLTRGQNGVMAKGTWRVDLSFRDTDQSDPRRGGDPTNLVLRPKIYFEQERVVPAFHLDRDGRERFLQVDLAYGLFERTSVFLSLPVATQRAHDVLHGTVNTAYDVWGMGDGVIGVRQSLAHRGALVGGLALKAPVARHTLIDDYDQTILEPTLQPGSGAWSVVPSLQYSFSGLFPDISWTTSASYELTATNDREYRFGNEAIATLGASRPLGGVVSASLQAKVFHKDRSTYRGTGVASTGTTVVYVTPGVRMRGPAGVGLYAFFQAPVYRYVNEAQLAPSHGWLVGLNRSF
jgi:hypothetical protein